MDLTRTLERRFLDRPSDDDDRSEGERSLLVRLMRLLAERPSLTHDHFPHHEHLRDQLVDRASRGADADEVEEAFLDLYCHLHMHEAPYTAEERRTVDETGGYWNHAGGLSPLLRAAPWIHEDTVSCDLGAGNGLQGLLLQALYPHRRTLQVEISGEAIEIGRQLQRWLGIPADRVEWVRADILDYTVTGIDFLYLYRPVRPVGVGKTYYERLSADLDRSEHPVVVFSIADCLRSFLSPRFELLCTDGHLTCFRGPLPSHRQPR